eukprot:6180255-Pleurochrysis_carterae.AAC.2
MAEREGAGGRKKNARYSSVNRAKSSQSLQEPFIAREDGRNRWFDAWFLKANNAERLGCVLPTPCTDNT